MAKYLLDTDAVIDYLVGRHSSVELIKNLHDGGETLCVCDVVIAEVHSGLRLKDREKAESLLASLEFLPTSFDSAKQAGDWRYLFSQRGIALSTTDALVAATANAHRAHLVTRNVKDYPMDGLSVLPLSND